MKEHKGYSYEAAEGSLDLLLRSQKGENTRIFDLIEYKIEVVKNGNENPVSKATVKIKVDGDIITKSAEGDGPVNALDTALRSALTAKFPELKALKLTDL